MDGFHVFDDISRADGPANLKNMSKKNKSDHTNNVLQRQWPYRLCVTFQPVALNVFPALPTVTVLSHMPGRLAAKE